MTLFMGAQKDVGDGGHYFRLSPKGSAYKPKFWLGERFRDGASPTRGK